MCAAFKTEIVTVFPDWDAFQAETKTIQQVATPCYRSPVSPKPLSPKPRITKPLITEAVGSCIGWYASPKPLVLCSGTRHGVGFACSVELARARACQIRRACNGATGVTGTAHRVVATLP